MNEAMQYKGLTELVQLSYPNNLRCYKNECDNPTPINYTLVFIISNRMNRNIKIQMKINAAQHDVPFVPIHISSVGKPKFVIIDKMASLDKQAQIRYVEQVHLCKQQYMNKLKPQLYAILSVLPICNVSASNF